MTFWACGVYNINPMKYSGSEVTLGRFIRRFEELLPVISRYVHKADRGDFAGLDLTFAQVMMLGLVSQKKAPKMKDLACELGVTLSNITSIIDRLVLSGYVKRYEDPSDRRVVRVELTLRGKSVAAKVAAHKKKCLERLFKKVQLSDRADIIRTMERLVEEIKKEGE